MINSTSNSDPWSLAFEFDRINRSSDVFVDEKLCKDAKNSGNALIRKFSRISYQYPGRCEATEGIVRYKYVSDFESEQRPQEAGDEKWKWTELVKRPGQIPLCGRCSTIENKIVHHQEEDVLQTQRSLNRVRPPHSVRCSSGQHESHRRAAVEIQTEAGKKYACKVEACPVKTKFQKPYTANAYMIAELEDKARREKKGNGNVGRRRKGRAPGANSKQATGKGS